MFCLIFWRTIHFCEVWFFLQSFVSDFLYVNTRWTKSCFSLNSWSLTCWLNADLEKKKRKKMHPFWWSRAIIWGEKKQHQPTSTSLLCEQIPYFHLQSNGNFIRKSNTLLQISNLFYTIKQWISWHFFTYTCSKTQSSGTKVDVTKLFKISPWLISIIKNVFIKIRLLNFYHPPDK